jgi:hypothetical protein
VRPRLRLTTLASTVALVISGIFVPVTVASAAPTPAPTGVWEGSYTCRQGLTGLRLTIGAGQGSSLTADFAFHALPSNPGGPSGDFTMRGTYSNDRMVLTQDHWVQQPAGYDMVDLASGPPTNGGKSLSGSVTTPGCTTFAVQKNVSWTSGPQPFPSPTVAWTSQPFGGTLALNRAATNTLAYSSGGAAAGATLIPDATLSKVAAAGLGVFAAWAGWEYSIGNCVEFNVTAGVGMYPWAYSGGYCT